jgi:hypothetical protein
LSRKCKISRIFVKCDNMRVTFRENLLSISISRKFSKFVQFSLKSFYLFIIFSQRFLREKRSYFGENMKSYTSLRNNSPPPFIFASDFALMKKCEIRNKKKFRFNLVGLYYSRVPLPPLCNPLSIFLPPRPHNVS